MSSDESEREGVNPRYRRARLEWRNPQMDAWLDTIDIFVRAKHFKEDGSSTAGAHIHNRLHTPRAVSHRGPVAGLPRDAYNPQWLAKLSDYELELLGPVNKPYSFVHENEVDQYVPLFSFCDPHGDAHLTERHSGYSNVELPAASRRLSSAPRLSLLCSRSSFHIHSTHCIIQRIIMLPYTSCSTSE